MRQAAEAGVPDLDVLTPQERECLRLVARHLSSKEIARELGISKASVDTYLNRARVKLGVASRRAAAQLVVVAPPASLPESLDGRARAYLERAMEAERKAAIGPEDVRREMIDLATQWRDLARVAEDLARGA